MATRSDRSVVTVVTDIHCTVVDTKKQRVRCNYCEKEIAGRTRLRQHLGGIGKDVSHCLKVPEDVKVQMKNVVMEGRKAYAKFLKSLESHGLPKMKSGSNDPHEQKGNHVSSQPSVSRKRNQSTIIESGLKKKDEGWILQEELRAIQEYVREVVHSWGSTGCSILLDGWIDGKGRNFIHFVVDSPRGPIFMKSADVSDIIGDVVAMITLLSGVIEEVGVQNVVQIISYTTLGSLNAVGKKLTEKYRTISWTVCAAHCIGLILEKIGMLDPWRGVLDKAKEITKFVYTHETVLKLMKKHTSGMELVSSRRIRSLTPFLILERIESQKNNLKIMFSSLEWKSSALASTADGTHVTDLVTGVSSFWTEAQMLLKGSLPLIRALHLISGGDSKPQLGYIYATMEQVKEAIKENYKDQKIKYQPFWTVFDGIWNNQLHSPIHSAAFFLNPGLFYSKDFNEDDEIKEGLTDCIERMVEDKRARYLIFLQLDEYIVARGSFGDGDAIDQRMTLSPEKWWSLYGGQCPELQNFAIRILGQTCTGALRYGLRRSLSEQLHMNGKNCMEQKQLTDLTFVHHNLRLQNPVSISSTDYRDIFLDEMDPMDEWVGGGDVKESTGEHDGD
ncbi:hypothetical protein MKW92_051413 [Papaver armeniacum]|nr:hypothetical protein MKW92_051413 [Papaver armeniacum]